MRAAGVLLAATCVVLTPGPATSFVPTRFTMRTRAHTRTLAPYVNKVSVCAVPGVGDEGCALPSPSRINTLPIPQQALTFGAVSTGLYVTTRLSIALVKIALQGPISGWQRSWGLLGFFYALVGMTHFTLKADTENIMPSQGAWGFWYLPGSKAFHVAWTGIVELLAGLWLGVGTVTSLLNISVLPTLWASPSADASLILLLLTILVTPANIYMFTHGARLPRSGPEFPLKIHLARGLMQVVLFTVLHEVARPAILVALPFLTPNH